MSWEPIRDFHRLTAADHAVLNRMRQRNIGKHEIKMAIETGSIEEGSTDTTIRYRLDMPGVDLLVAVDIPKEQIVTVFYDNEQGAEGGKL